MANDISANPWKIDTASANVIYAFQMKITNIIWADYTLGGAQTLVVQDANGKQIVQMVTGTSTTAAPLQTGFIGWVRGLKVPTLGSGEVTIFVGAGK
jgi:hypothetical protein